MAVPFPLGGSDDVVARMVEPRLARWSAPEAKPPKWSCPVPSARLEGANLTFVPRHHPGGGALGAAWIKLHGRSRCR
jgi:hypothetical protein